MTGRSVADIPSQQPTSAHAAKIQTVAILRMNNGGLDVCSNFQLESCNVGELPRGVRHTSDNLGLLFDPTTTCRL